ncbi:MAG: peptide-methionine (R)-S-oxide reductase MsrB [Actinomycetota bacterium]|nr:peptide-methionine (R)-S-oxide reductase MsrB [Actinomycetota bacterium]
MKKFSEIDLRERLTPLQYRVTQEAGTERPFTGGTWDSKDPGTYKCVVCDAQLFKSNTKYDSGSGWPSFWEAIDPSAVQLHEDRGLGMVRTEVTCANCGAHLGHLFPDGPQPTGQRYCMNSASMTLEPEED